MKTKKTIIFAGLIVLASAVFVLSCDSPLGLGDMLDIKGPVVEFTSPAARTPVGATFTIEGRVSDRSQIEKLLLKVSTNSEEFPKQWRYSMKQLWEVSEDKGVSWKAYPQAEWNGTNKSAEWVIPLDLSINGVSAEDGEYMFTVQAWDTGGFTDDNSIKTLVIIYDKDPPIVEVYNPFLYDRFLYDGTNFKEELETLFLASTWEEPALLGKYLTQEFQLQWQIDDQHDIWSIELLFYEYNAIIDGIGETEVPQDYIYYYHENLPPVELDPLNNIKPNGSVWVPDLAGAVGTYSGEKYKDGIIKKSLDDKTVIKVVSVCHDAAGHVNQEKVLGYIVFWPQAAQPWITFTDGMLPPGDYDDYTKLEFEDEAFMIYPGRNIRANAFQAQGVSRVEFTLHLFDLSGSPNIIGPAMSLAFMEQNMDEYRRYTDATKTKVAIHNPPRPNGNFSTSFSWNFMPEARTNNYVVRAVAFDANGKAGNTTYEAAFRVQDITFPDFPTPPNPTASEPLFKFIGRPEADGRPAAPANSIRISGVVADATDVVSVYMAWINPESIDFAAMSQLSYFRDAKYEGWMNARAYGGTWPMQEGKYDGAHPNKVWKVPITANLGEDPDTGRKLFRYEQVISLSELNIGIGGSNGQPLNSQVFLLRAENPDEKCTIITYAPPGDTGVPTMEITSVKISNTNSGALIGTYTPGQGFIQIPKFTGNETITVNGIWKEDSTEYLDSQPNFYSRMEFLINGKNINGYPGTSTTITVTPASAVSAKEGEFTVTADVKNTGTALNTSDLTDTLVVNVSARDIGNNRTEDGASWLIESDTLRFLRISSENEDRAYRAGAGNDSIIKIFIEFNKAVLLNPGRSRPPVLRLNTGGIATYDADQNSESTRHYFIYTVGANENTANLNVSGISIDGGTSALATNTPDTVYEAANYPFTFINTNTAELNPANWTTEEIRLTRNTLHTGIGNVGTENNKIYYRAVPVDVNNASEKPFTLGGGKSISVDNTPPTILTNPNITASPAGWHKEGVEIYITAAFSEKVKLGSNTPYLLLNTGGTDANRRTSTVLDDIRVNNDKITFKYFVKAGDTATTADLQVNGFGGDILDIPGNRMIALGGNRTLTGIRLDTSAPAVPTVTVLQGTIAAPGAEIASPTGNLYYDNVFVRFTGGTGDTNLGRVEYSLNDDGTNNARWNSSTNTNGITNVQLDTNGTFNISARQIDRAGNTSGTSAKITFNLDKGTLINSITSTNPNGDYTRHDTREDHISIQVNFRKQLTFPANTTQTLTLNVTGGAANTNVATYRPTTNVTASQATFTYDVASGHTTGNNNLTVSGITFNNITDGTGTVPAAALAVPAAANNMGNLKAIRIVTGGLTAGTPDYAITAANDEATGTISITFNRPISKGSVGDITIAQSTTGYRLPAVLTEAQSARYRNARNFSTLYTRGTNGFINNPAGSDTSTKFVLNYAESTVVTPANTGSAIVQMAYDFLQAETVTLPVTSQDVTASGSTLTINLTGTNALQVLGASYTITIPANCVQDALDYTWPATATNYTTTTPGINKSFVRVNKQTNRDTVTRTTGDGSNTNPWLTTNQILQTTARLDCRTPDSVVRYNVTGQRFDARGANGTATGTTNATGTGGGRPSQTGTAAYYMNTDADANNVNYLNQPDLAEKENTGTVYNTFTGNNTNAAGPHITVGDNTEHGYVWRISTRSRNGTNGANNGAISEEIAFRTVLTVQLDGMTAEQGLGAPPDSGDALWILGGDAISASSVPGFPLTWSDDFNSLETEKKRAGKRLMRLDGTVATSFATSQWKWVTWEVNVRTYYDIVLGRDVNTGTEPDAAKAWQYGPRTWASQRGGWSILKDTYSLYPGKHRWLRIYSADFDPGGYFNFSQTFSSRPDLDTSITYTP